MLENGFKVQIAFQTSGATLLAEMEINDAQLPGIEGGGAIPQTTMSNLNVRTQLPKLLKTITAGNLTISFSAAALTQFYANVQVNQQMTFTLPNNGTYTVWGWIETFNPAPFREGEKPSAAVRLEISNLNNATPRAITPPAYVAPA
jgi:hypothetical protein